ncbi:MAG: Flp pilus assembly complex ATPase component TadA, partial [Verrucomicrobiae bacterium]|nr:Flp pilus assembly complex ATPase component TadA [Verrucomicrobiae bacterium]
MYANEDYLIELLQESGRLEKSDLDSARQMKKGQDTMLETLLKLGKLTEEDVARELAVSSGMDFVDLTKLEIDEAVTGAMEAEVALRYKVVPVGFNGSHLYVAVSDPLDFDTLDSVRHVIQYEPEFVCATRAQIRQCLIEFYSGEMTAEQAQELNASTVTVGGNDDMGAGKEGGDAPVIRLVHQILAEAYQHRASDIHIEPLENELRIRYRIDGSLHKVASHPRRLMSAVVSRIKIMTGS